MLPRPLENLSKKFLHQKVHHLLVTFTQKMDYGWIHTPDRFLSLVIGW